MESKDVYLTGIKQRIRDGEFDEYLSIPFANKESLIKIIEGKIKQKLIKDATPVLTDTELMTVIVDMREGAVGFYGIMLKYGFFEKYIDDNGDSKSRMTEKGARAIRDYVVHG